MREILFIAWHDARHQLRQGPTLVWAFLMPPIFFYFIGTMTGGFSSGLSGQDTPIVVVAESPGFLQEQIDRRLRDNNFTPEWVASAEGSTEAARTLTLSPNLTDKILAGTQTEAVFETTASALTRDFELIRVQRAMYTALADIVVAGIGSEQMLNCCGPDQAQRNTSQAATGRVARRHAQENSAGFEQAIPGILVMFTILVLLTSGGSMLVIERKQGLLRRLASAPFSRFEVISGKWGGRMLLAVIQMTIALLVGTYVFKMVWGPDFGMVLVVLAAWAGFCAFAGLLLGSVANTEGQAAGLGVLFANGLAALGGCWWPIEVTPQWMQMDSETDTDGLDHGRDAQADQFSVGCGVGDSAALVVTRCDGCYCDAGGAAVSVSVVLSSLRRMSKSALARSSRPL